MCIKVLRRENRKIQKEYKGRTNSSVPIGLHAGKFFGGNGKGKKKIKKRRKERERERKREREVKNTPNK